MVAPPWWKGCGRGRGTRQGPHGGEQIERFARGAAPDWSLLKSELSRVSLETLRDFDYTEARSEFWFVGKQGIIDTRLKGPAGSRNLKLVFHGDETRRPSREQEGGRP